VEANELAEDIRVNPEALDVEAAQQAELFFKWAERAVEARADMDRAKLAVDLIEARLGIRMRAKPELYNLTKVTDPAIASAVKRHEKYLDAFQTFLKAKETSALMEKAAEAMEQKKRMIEVLITLHGQEYFAGPSVPRDLGAAWSENQKQREGRTNDKLRDKVRGRKEEA
jgi:hypothetical protein